MVPFVEPAPPPAWHPRPADRGIDSGAARRHGLAQMNARLTILSPVPERTAEAATPTLAWALPDRVRLGVLSNGKPNTSHLLDGVLEVLAVDPRVVLTVRARKASASLAADQAVLDRLSAGSDLVVCATAD